MTQNPTQTPRPDLFERQVEELRKITASWPWQPTIFASQDPQEVDPSGTYLMQMTLVCVELLIARGVRLAQIVADLEDLPDGAEPEPAPEVGPDGPNIEFHRDPVAEIFEQQLNSVLNIAETWPYRPYETPEDPSGTYLNRLARASLVEMLNRGADLHNVLDGLGDAEDYRVSDD